MNQNEYENSAAGAEVQNRYILENDLETHRLDLQNCDRNYDLRSEVTPGKLHLRDGGRVLDAGCGNGIVTETILDYYDGTELTIDAIDKSELMIEALNAKQYEVRKKYPHATVNYSVEDLEHFESGDHNYDLIVCRFVIQHIPYKAQTVIKNFSKVLREDGTLIIIDVDGILFGLRTSNKFLQKCLRNIAENTPNFDCYSCKKMPKLLMAAGLDIIDIDHHIMLFFSENDRKNESQNWNMRFDQVKTQFETILGVSTFNKFRRCYIDELNNRENLIYYNKFVFFARKSNSQNSL